MGKCVVEHGHPLPQLHGRQPNALVADRTGLGLEPAPDGSVCLVTSRGADIELPRIVLRPRRGAPPTADDQPFLGELSRSARTRLPRQPAPGAAGCRAPCVGRESKPASNN